jgi:hypothetical protein
MLLFVLLVAAGLLFFSKQSVTAKEEGDGKMGRRLAKPMGVPNRTLVNVGQLAMWIYADATSAVDPDGNSGVIFPRGTAGVIYQDGLIFGGYVRDGAEPALRVGGQAYTSGMQPGRIISKGVIEDQSAPDVRIWRIRRDYKDADLRNDAAEIFRIPLSQVGDAEIASVRQRYETDWNEWPAAKGAPYYDKNGDGQYDRTVDEPGIADADQVVWVVANDYSNANTVGLYGSPQVGVEEQVTLWAYRRADALGHIIFKQFKLIYKGLAATPANATIDTLYLCQWSDPDLGEFTDDLAGSDTELSLGFVYNASSIDNSFNQFSLPPPASGYDFFAGPAIPDPNGTAIINLKKRSGFRNLPMTRFGFFAAGGEDSDPTRAGPYDGTLHWWNLLQGFRPRPIAPPQRKIDPTTGQPSLFWVNGDPVAGTGWLDSSPQDRRIYMVSGPVDRIALGDTAETVVALMAGLGSDRLSSISVLKFYDRTAQFAFDNLFDLPKPPPSPKFTATPFENAVLLNWGSDPEGVAATEGQDEKGFKFEGYNVYQLPSASATFDQAIKLATYDVPNEVTTVLNEQFDVASGVILQLPAQIGKNSGIARTLQVTTDRVRDRPLSNGQTYYFAVTAYNYNPDPALTTKSLESPLQIISVVPQGPKPGVRYPLSSGQKLTIKHDGSSDGTAEAIVVDPTKTNGHAYEITFAANAEGTFLWTLTDKTANKVVLADQTNQSGDDNYLIIDGLQVKVIGPPPGMKDWEIPAGVRRFTWAGGADGLHFEGFNGAIGWASPASVFGSGIPGVPAATIKNVLLKLAPTDEKGVFDPSHSDVSFAYRYGRGFAGNPAKPEFAPYIINKTGPYGYQDFTKSVPLAAYDVEANPPRRLVLGFLENNVAGGSVDGKWWPPDFNTGNNTAGSGPREWLWIFDADYSETPNPAFQVEAIGNPLPVMYFLTVARRGNISFSDEDEFLILANHVNSDADKFSFASQAPIIDQNVAKVDVDKLVNVFPNPYYGLNRAELGRFIRYVTFSHLPQKATIRIFTLAGVLVRTLMKDDDSQFIRWDLLNEEGLPAASGIYVVHVDMPELGKTKILKLAMVREEQFVPNY